VSELIPTNITSNFILTILYIIIMTYVLTN